MKKTNEFKKMKVQQCNEILSVSKKLVEILEKEIKKSRMDTRKGVVLNFRDPNYRQESSGFHPVEIAISPQGIIQYITDFSYVGSPPYGELVKELDFDFSLKRFQQQGREYHLDDGIKIYQMWGENFCNYYEMGVYQIELGAFC